MSQGSVGIRWRFLKGAIGGSIEDRGVGGQHVATLVLGSSCALRLDGSLRGLLVLLRLAGGGGGASFRDQLGCSRRREIIVML